MNKHGLIFIHVQLHFINPDKSPRLDYLCYEISKYFTLQIFFFLISKESDANVIKLPDFSKLKRLGFLNEFVW